MRSAAANWADFTFDEFRGERHSEKVAIRARIGLGDELAGATSSLRVTLCVAPPAPCGDAHFDAAVAAVVEHHLAKDLRVLWMYLPTRDQTVTISVNPEQTSPSSPSGYCVSRSTDGISQV